VTDPVMRALAYLSRVVEQPCPDLAALMSSVGPVEAAERVKRRAVDDRLARLTDALVRESRAELASTLRDVVARAVAQELSRHRTR